MASNAYENPYQGAGGDSSAGTAAPSNAEAGSWSSLAAAAYLNSSSTESRSTSTDKNFSNSRSGNDKGANGQDGFSIFGDSFNFGNAFKNGGNDKNDKAEEGKDSKEDKGDKDQPNGSDDSLDFSGLNELYAMAAADLLNDEKKDKDEKGKDDQDKDGKDKDGKGLDTLDGLDIGLGDGLFDEFGGEEESDTCHQEDSSNNNEGGDTEQVKSNALNSAAAAAQAAMSGDLSKANAINLNAVYSQLEGEKSEAFSNGNGAVAADLSYAQSYVTDAIAKTAHANQVSASTTAAGGQTSELSQIIAGISGGDTNQSAINRTKPEYLRTA